MWAPRPQNTDVCANNKEDITENSIIATYVPFTNSEIKHQNTHITILHLCHQSPMSTMLLIPDHLKCPQSLWRNTSFNFYLLIYNNFIPLDSDGARTKIHCALSTAIPSMSIPAPWHRCPCFNWLLDAISQEPFLVPYITALQRQGHTLSWRSEKTGFSSSKFTGIKE